MAKNPRLIDLAGQRFGRWSVLRQDGNTAGGGALWACVCDCGTESTVLGADLRRGKSTNCGCLNRDRLGDLRRSHGNSGTRLHETWKNMRARCAATEGKKGEHYGGRGITVCPEWSNFTVFRDWAIANGYSDDLTIERVNVNGNYEPGNCTWIPRGDQAFNRRFVSRAPDGELWWHKAKANGVTSVAYRQRVAAGWPIEQAISWPMGRRRKAHTRDAAGRFS